MAQVPGHNSDRLFRPGDGGQHHSLRVFETAVVMVVVEDGHRVLVRAAMRFFIDETPAFVGAGSGPRPI